MMARVSNADLSSGRLEESLAGGFRVEESLAMPLATAGHDWAAEAHPVEMDDYIEFDYDEEMELANEHSITTRTSPFSQGCTPSSSPIRCGGMEVKRMEFQGAVSCSSACKATGDSPAHAWRGSPADCHDERSGSDEGEEEEEDEEGEYDPYGLLSVPISPSCRKFGHERFLEYQRDAIARERGHSHQRWVAQMQERQILPHSLRCTGLRMLLGEACRADLTHILKSEPLGKQSDAYLRAWRQWQQIKESFEEDLLAEENVDRVLSIIACMSVFNRQYICRKYNENVIARVKRRDRMVKNLITMEKQRVLFLSDIAEAGTPSSPQTTEGLCSTSSREGSVTAPRGEGSPSLVRGTFEMLAFALPPTPLSPTDLSVPAESILMARSIDVGESCATAKLRRRVLEAPPRTSAPHSADTPGPESPTTSPSVSNRRLPSYLSNIILDADEDDVVALLDAEESYFSGCSSASASPSHCSPTWQYTLPAAVGRADASLLPTTEEWREGGCTVSSPFVPTWKSLTSCTQLIHAAAGAPQAEQSASHLHDGIAMGPYDPCDDSVTVEPEDGEPLAFGAEPLIIPIDYSSSPQVISKLLSITTPQFAASSSASRSLRSLRETSSSGGAPSPSLGNSSWCADEDDDVVEPKAPNPVDWQSSWADLASREATTSAPLTS